MTRRRWIVPALLALPFVLAVAADVYRAVAAPDHAVVHLLEGDGEIRFTPSDVVVDLRQAQRPAPRPGLTMVELGSGWGEGTPQGQWTSGHRATLRWLSEIDRLHVLYLEARADRKKGPAPQLLVAINGSSCGVVTLTEKMTVHAIELVGDELRIGANEMELELVEKGSSRRAENRTLLLRRLGLARDGTGGFPRPSEKRPIVVRPDEGLIVVRRPGRIELPFEVAMGGSRLSFRYRFRSPDPRSQCEVTIGRRWAARDRYDVVRREVLRPKDRVAGRIHQMLRDRAEPCVVILDVNAAAAVDGFVVRDPVLEIAR